MSAPDEAETDAADPAYAFKPSLMGAISRFALKSDGLSWEIGSRTGLIPYERVRAVRLSYRPVTMQSHRFVTEIWSPGNPKVQIVSSSWRSMMEQERLDAPYVAFVTELHRRIAAAGGTAQFTTGLPVVSYWVGLAMFVAVILAMAVLLVRSTGLDQWSSGAIIAAITLVFALQIGNFFRRNWPLRYGADAIPRLVLPRA